MRLSDKVEDFRFTCLETIKRRIAESSDLFEYDFIYLSAVNRAIEVAEGFKHAVKTQNLTVMPVLLRVQINTLSTLHFIESNDQRGEIIQEFNRGVEFRHIRMPGTKKRIVEAELISKASTKYPWISSVYTNTSSWVHLSPTSTYSPINMNLEGNVSLRIPRIPDPKFELAIDELCECMGACLDGIVTNLNLWAVSTDHSELGTE